jgi:hypothetical protein
VPVDVPPALPIGFRRPQVGAIVERSPHENGLVQGDLREAGLSHDCEFLGDVLGPGGGAESNSGCRQGLTGIGGVALEREPLHLDAQQLQVRDVSLLGSETLDPLGIIERLDIFLGQGNLLAGDQRACEGALHLKDYLAADVL